jgi:hypothetical protein
LYQHLTRHISFSSTCIHVWLAKYICSSSCIKLWPLNIIEAHTKSMFDSTYWFVTCVLWELKDMWRVKCWYNMSYNYIWRVKHGCKVSYTYIWRVKHGCKVSYKICDESCVDTRSATSLISSDRTGETIIFKAIDFPPTLSMIRTCLVYNNI